MQFIWNLSQSDLDAGVSTKGRKHALESFVLVINF